MRRLSYHCAGVEGGLVAPEVPDVGKLSADVPSVGGGVSGSLPGISADTSMPSVDVDVPSGSLDVGGKLMCCGVDEASVPGGRGGAFGFVVALSWFVLETGRMQHLRLMGLRSGSVFALLVARPPCRIPSGALICVPRGRR